MSKELVIDVNKSEWGEVKPDFLNTALYADSPVFAEFMDVYEKGEEISDELKSRMQDQVDLYKKANKVEEVHNIQSNLFALEKVLATALNAMENGREYRDEIQLVLREMDFEIKEITRKDLKERGGVVMNIDGKKVHLYQDNVSELFPELSGEQAGFILSMANQAMVADAGMRELAKTSLRKGEAVLFQASHDEQDVFCTLSIRDGRVKLVSSQNFNVANSMELDENDFPRIEGKVESSMSYDITDLTGDKFKMGRAGGRAQMQVGYRLLEGDDKGIIDSIRKLVTNPEKSVNQDLEKFREGIKTERKESGKYQSDVRVKGSEEKKLSEQELGARNLLHNNSADMTPHERRANKIFMLGHSHEFVADMMGPELNQKTELWKAYKEYIPDKEFDKNPINKYAASAEIFGVLEKDQENKMAYGAKKIVEATRDAGKTIKAETVKSILTHLVPDDKKPELEKNAGMIARAATETKNLSFGNKVLKVLDEMKVRLSFVSKDVAEARNQAQQEKKKGREIKKGGFVAKLLKRRSEEQKSKESEIRRPH